jgi:rhomboid-related protein 1/2/3
LIKENPNQCKDIPNGLAKAVLRMHDADGDNRLDFEEFYELSKEHHWLIRDMCVKYCRYIVPPRSGHADETGEQ